MPLNAEKYRIVLSRIAGAVLLFLLFGTRSHWDIDHEMIQFFLNITGILLVGIASLGRMWCSLYIAGYKDNTLITKGPYSICRNPLYLFSMIGALGISCFTETFTFPLVFMMVFSIYYPFVIKREEKRLKRIFGAEFDLYLKKVPVFFPRFSTFEEPDTYPVNPVVYRRHIFSAIWFIWVAGIIKLTEIIRETWFIGSLLSLY